MTRIRSILVSTAAILALIAAPVMAQTVPAPPPALAAPGSISGPPPEFPKEKQLKEKQVEGPVKKVDPAAKTVQVGWFLGLFHTTLEVTDDTQIAVDGMKASLADIREGARVKAAYEARDGKNIAKVIEVMPAAEQEGAAARGGLPAPPPSPIGASIAPPSGRPRTE